jgi:hypothetical protein
MADGAYQNAYWPSVGALVAIGYARTGQQRMARSILEQIARGFLAEGTIHEWYRIDGRPSGAAFYQWPARMYLIALYSAYLGLGDGSTIRFNKASSPLRKYCLGSGKARIQSRGVDLLAVVKVGRQVAPSQICTVTVSRQR